MRWGEVAAWGGRRLHPLAEFPCLHRVSALRGTSAPYLASAAPEGRPFDHEPECGPLPGPQATAVVEVLSAQGGGADQACWFAMWDGYAWLYSRAGSGYAPLVPAHPWPRARRALWRAAHLGLPLRGTDHRILPPLLGGGHRRKPLHPAGANRDGMVHAEIRDYLLYRGPLQAALASPEGLEAEAHWGDEGRMGWADLWWPEDRSWLLASDTDLDSTYLGGSMSLIEAILACPALEALRVGPGDPVTADSDALNGC